MSETNPGYSDDRHAGEVGSRRATVGTSTDPESINVPLTRGGAAENAMEEEARREAHETFVPEAPQADDRTDATRSRAVEEESLRGGAPGRVPESTTPYQASAVAATAPPGAGHRERHRDGRDEEERVRESIRETRRELGDTVSALAHKADVKSRAADAAGSAKERAAAMVGTAKAKAHEMSGKAHEMSGTAKARAGEVSGTARAKAHEVSGTAKTRATELGGKVRENAPEKAGMRPVLGFAAAGAVVALLVRRARRRRRVR